MNRKKVFHWMLLAAMVVGIGTCVTSCKDDDDDKDSGTEEVGGTSEMNANDDAMLLASILRNLCEFSEETVTPAILNQQFEPVVGTVDDESQPTVRSIVAGTQADADAYAAKLLCTLGIGSSQADGFRYQNAAIGTISYQHGTGNELGVISFDVKQIPHLTKLVFTATGKENADSKPYYKEGDVVKYKDRTWICVEVFGENNPLVTFLSFDDYSHYKGVSTNTCKWSLTGNDVYYDGPQADAQVLINWLKKFILDKQMFEKMQRGLLLAGLSDISSNQVLPSDNERRVKLMKSVIKDPSKVVIEAWQTINNEQYIRLLSDESVYRETVKKKEGSWEIVKYSPTGLLLCNTMRWSGVVGTHDYWVPYLMMMKDSKKTRDMQDVLNDTPSQTTLSPSHFKWDMYSSIEITDEEIGAGKYYPYKVAIHWTHTPYTQDGNNKYKYYGLLDFTKLPTESPNYDWEVRNITSRQMSFTDTGKALKGSVIGYRVE